MNGPFARVMLKGIHLPTLPTFVNEDYCVLDHISRVDLLRIALFSYLDLI